MMTVEQIADVTGMSQAVILERIESGALRAARVNDRWRVSTDELERFWRLLMDEMVEALRPEIEEDLVGLRRSRILNARKY